MDNNSYTRKQCRRSTHFFNRTKTKQNKNKKQINKNKTKQNKTKAKTNKNKKPCLYWKFTRGQTVSKSAHVSCRIYVNRLLQSRIQAREGFGMLRLSWPLVSLWPHECLHSGQGFFWSNFVVIEHPWVNLPLVDLCVTFDPKNVLHSGHGLFWPNLVVITHSWVNWPLVDLCGTFDPANV